MIHARESKRIVNRNPSTFPTFKVPNLASYDKYNGKYKAYEDPEAKGYDDCMAGRPRNCNRFLMVRKRTFTTMRRAVLWFRGWDLGDKQKKDWAR